MYFGSMNYATRIYTYSLIKPAFPFLQRICTRLTFSRKVGCNISLVVDDFFVSKIITKIYYDEITIKYINTVSANSVTDFAQQFFFYLD